MSSFKEQADQFIEDVTIIQPSNEHPQLKKMESLFQPQVRLQ